MHFSGFTLDQKERLRVALHGAHGIAFDGCHKVYILDTRELYEQMDGYQYREEVTPGEVDTALATLNEWMRQSVDDVDCAMGFVQLIADVNRYDDPNQAYLTIVGQGELNISGMFVDDDDEDW